MSNFDFRNRRPRFRRDVLAFKGMSGRDTGLASTSTDKFLSNPFKSQPSILNPDYFVAERPLVVGACQTCTTFSKVTIVNQALLTKLPIKSVFHRKGKLLTSFNDESAQTKVKPVTKADLVQTINTSPVVSAAVKLDDSDTRQPLDVFEAANFQTASEERPNWIQKIVEYLGKKILEILFPGGIFYHSGQFDIMARAELAGSPFLFICRGGSVLDSAVVNAVLSHQSESISSKTLFALQRSRFWSRCNRRLFGLGTSFDVFEDSQDGLIWSVQSTIFSTIFSLGFNLLLSPIPVYQDPELQDALFHVADLVTSNCVADIQIVPVTLSYEQTFEQLTGSDQLSMWKIFLMAIGFETRHCGSVRVDFDQPLSAKEFFQTWDNRGIDPNTRFEYLYKHLKWNAVKLHRFASTELLSFLLCHDFRLSAQVSLTSLKESFVKLRKDLSTRKKRDFSFSGPSDEVLLDALFLMQPHIQVRNETIHVTSSAKQILKEKAERILQVYISEAVVAIATGSLVQIPLKTYIGTKIKVSIDQHQLFRRASQLFRLLSNEFPLCAPCESFDKGFDDGLDALKMQEIVAKDGEIQGEHLQDRKSRQLAHNLLMDGFDFGDESCQKTYLTLNLSQDSIEKLFYYQNLIKDRIVKYYKVVSILPVLLDKTDFDKEDFLELVRAESPDEGVDIVVDQLVLLDVDIVVDQLVLLDVITEMDGFILLQEKWNSKKDLESLLCQVNKFIL